MDIVNLLIIAGVPSAVTGFCFWIVEEKLSKREATMKEMQEKHHKESEEKEKLREESQFITLQSVNAAIALAEATARAIQRIPDAKCNGDMKQALQYAQQVKHEQKEFLTRQGIKNIQQH